MLQLSEVDEEVSWDPGCCELKHTTIELKITTRFPHLLAANPACRGYCGRHCGECSHPLEL